MIAKGLLILLLLVKLLLVYIPPVTVASMLPLNWELVCTTHNAQGVTSCHIDRK